jgi:hypothetical protein
VWRALHNKELYDLYSRNIIRVIKSRRWAGYVARIGEIRDVYRVLVRKHEWQRPFGRHSPREEGNIKMDFQEVEWGGMNFIDLAQNRDRWLVLVNAVMNFRAPQNAGNFLTS